jgi:hypothetical protein
MKLPAPRTFLYGALLLALGLFFWWKYGGDPRSAFLAEVDGMIQAVNQGEHLSLRKKLSPEAEATIADRFMPVQQALFTARKLDGDRNSRYRLANLNVFYAADYAEIEIERSGPNGDFTDSRRFPLPFVYLKGNWLVAGGFRGERDFSNPFE